MFLLLYYKIAYFYLKLKRTCKFTILGLCNFGEGFGALSRGLWLTAAGH